MHTPDGDLCVECFKKWTVLAGKGGVLFPLLTLGFSTPLFVLLNPMIAIGAMLGFVAVGASISKSLVPGRRSRFIDEGQPVLPKATTVR